MDANSADPAARIRTAPALGDIIAETSRPLAPEQAVAGQRFGHSVSMFAHTALVGAPSAGRVYVLQRDHDLAFVDTDTLAPSHSLPDFGSAVAVWGEIAAVGAPGQETGQAGAVVIFERDEFGWIEEVTLTPRDSAAGDGFGSAVHLAGDTLIVGAPGATGMAAGSGAAYIFTKTLNGWIEAAKLHASQGHEGAVFGASVAVRRDIAMVGAPGTRTPAADTGAAYIFTRGPGAWTEAAMLTPQSSPGEPGGAGQRFGASVALGHDIALIGAPGNALAGAAYIMTHNKGAWTQRARLEAGDAGKTAFGQAVALQGNTALVGAAAQPGQPRSAYLFEYNGATWKRTARMDSPTSAEDDGFAAALAMSTNTVLIGAATDSAAGAGAGTAYAYARTAPLAAQLTCQAADTLGSLASCIHDQMPIEGSGGYVIPSPAEQADWRGVVADMLQGSCAMSLPPSLSGAMQLGEFTDLDNGKTYCVLMEITDADNNGYVDKGWGTFVVDSLATRELSHQAPHPYNDYRTSIEAINIFKGSNSRTYLMCGAHRHANATPSACDIDYDESDCAHSIDNMYYPTTLELDGYYGAAEHIQIQWHGMADSTCPNLNIYMSHGLSSAPPEWSNVNTLMANALLYHPSWAVDVPGDGTCPLSATRNTEGRYLNGVPEGDVCLQRADASTNKFVHVEQERAFRYASEWLGPVADTWPAAGEPPPPPAPAVPAAPANLTAMGARKKVMLGWDSVSDATSYNVHRSTVSGGPYTVIAITTSPDYRDNGVPAGVTYYYMVTAANAAGESAPSNEASATTN